MKEGMKETVKEMEEPESTPESTLEFTVDAWEDGASFLVKAHAGSRRDVVSGVHGGMVKVEVTSAPERGKANRAIGKLLAKCLGVSSSSVELLSGDTNSRKRFGVRGMSPDSLRAALSRHLRLKVD